MVEIGQIQKPEAGSFAGKRKLYCVANIFTVEDAPEDYKDLVNKYWEEVIRQIEKIEIAGRIKKVFCEIISQADEALDILAKINETIPQIIKKRLDDGGSLIPLEDAAIFASYTDWNNCLRVVYSKEVFTKVLQFYTEISEKRLQHILNVIDNNLVGDEAGLLIMKDEDRVKLQFPKDIEVFLITPPSYDDIIRWFREKMIMKSKEASQE